LARYPAKIGGQLGIFSEGSVGSDRAPENDAGLCHSRGDDVRIKALLCRTLVEEITDGAPRLQSRLHGWRGDRLIEKAQRGLIGFQFSDHRSDPSLPKSSTSRAAAPAEHDAASKRSLRRREFINQQRLSALIYQFR
jgi:hypothetical protein